MKLLLDEPGILRVLHDPDAGLQVHEWFDYDPDGDDRLILGLLDRIFELLVQHPAEKLLVRTEKARGAFSPGVQNFIRDVQFPRLVEGTEVRFVATVRSRDADLMETLGTELWRQQLSEHAPLILYDVGSESEGRAWLDLVTRIDAARTG